MNPFSISAFYSQLDKCEGKLKANQLPVTPQQSRIFKANIEARSAQQPATYELKPAGSGEYHAEPSVTNKPKFTLQEQKIFLQHCHELYGKNQPIQIHQEILKRDLVCAAVEKEGLVPTLHFVKEYQIMRQTIKEFSEISKLNIPDLNELYYFLKSDI